MQRDLSPEELALANEANFVDFHKQLACLPGARVDERQDMVLFTTPIPMGGFNGVLRARLSPDEIERKLREVERFFAARGVRWNWEVGPESEPADLGQRLEKLGLRKWGQESGMAADLLSLNEAVQAPRGLKIEHVRDRQALDKYMHAMVTGFGPPQEFSEAWGQVFTCLGLGPDVPLQHYLGTLDGEAVSSTSLFLGAGVAGIYFVATVPAARRMGIASALILAALREARAMGYRVAILQASDMGNSVYRRLGFETHGTFAFYSP